MRTPIDAIRRLGLVACGSLVLGYTLPGAIALATGVYFKDSLEAVVQAKYPSVIANLRQHESNQAQLRAALATADNPALRLKYEMELKKPAPVSIQPMHLHTITLFWPLMYFGLGTVIFVLTPRVAARIPWKKTLVLAAGAYGLMTWALLLRTLGASTAERGRVVYAYSNPDLDPFSFAVQLLSFAAFSVLLAVIWSMWSAVYAELKIVLDSMQYNQIEPRRLDMLSETLLRWQATFVAISTGFVVYTAIFWDQIVKNGDARSWFEAIIAHGMWLITLGVTAAPLAITWHAWKSAKQRAIIQLLNAPSNDSGSLEAKRAAIENLDPIGKWNIAASAVTVLSSLAGPLLQAFIK